MSPEKSPHLTPDIVADEHALVEAIEALLIDHPEMLRHRRRIVRRQEELRRVASSKEWQSYLRLEEVVNARYDLSVRLVAVWAFEHGRRCR